MGHADVMLGHNVEYTGSMSRLPILVLECSKGGHLEGGPCQTGLKSGFLSVDDNRDMKARDSCIL